MKKISIGYNKTQEQRDKINVKAKSLILSKAITLCESHVPIKNLDSFKASFSKYVVNAITENFQLKEANLEKIIELTNIPYKQIKTIERNYKAIHIDTMQPDYNIYAKNENEIKLFEELQLLCEQLNKYKAMPSFHVITALNNRIRIEEGRFIPNHYYIQNTCK